MLGRWGLQPIPFLLIATGIVAMVALTACGAATVSTEGEVATPIRRSAAVATMPAARFESVAVQSGLTETAVMSTTTAVAEGPDLTLGERVYTNRCAECHGAQAEGGSASAVAGLTMSEATFVDLLRTGGDIGPEHLFGTRAVSENGIDAMYAYLQSLE